MRQIIRKVPLLAGLGWVVFTAHSAISEPTTLSTAYSFTGEPGLIEMPSAEVGPDGALTFSFSKLENITLSSMNFQITPRLNGTFRYSALTNFRPAYPIYTDRSFDLSYRVLDEGDYLPAINVGINDFIGTGLGSSEYVVATKSFVDDRLRVTAGLGWGRLATRGAIGSPFGARPDFDFGLGGTVNYNQWFRGPVAPFGGLSFQVNDKLTLLAEYTSDAYIEESAAGTFTPRTPFNFGAKYQVRPGVSLSAYYLQGSKVGLQISAVIDPNRPAAVSGIEPAPLPVRPRPSRETNPHDWGTDWSSDPAVEPGIRGVLAAALAKDGMQLEAMSLSATRAEIRISNSRYGSHAQAIGRATRMMTRAFPASVENFVVTIVSHGIPVSSMNVTRSDVERLEHAPAAEMLDRAVFTDPVTGPQNGLHRTPDLYPRFTWSLQPYMTLGLFDPNSPVRAGIGLRLGASYEISPGLVFSGSLTKNLGGNLGEGVLGSISTLPHVRSDADLYATQGDPAIETLTLAWYSRPGPDLYSRVTVGLLEPMFGGISGELLWKPVDSRFALGAELAFVQQRDFNQLFGFQDYSTVTGHVSGYYDLGNNFTAQLDVGRYLAGDYGATLSVDRVFANGWKVGAFATITNLSAEEFGEGTFDKGLRISIPMDWALGTPSRASTSTELRSLSSDGGARLQVEGRLFDWVQDGHADALSQRWGKFWR